MSQLQFGLVSAACLFTGRVPGILYGDDRYPFGYYYGNDADCYDIYVAVTVAFMNGFDWWNLGSNLPGYEAPFTFSGAIDLECARLSPGNPLWVFKVTGGLPLRTRLGYRLLRTVTL